MMGLLASILVSDILPIFAIASAGFLLARYAGIDVKMVSRVVFYSLLPCLAFRLLVTRSADGVRVDRPLPEEIMRPVDILSDTALLVVILVLGMQLERALWPERP
jgi:predicted permease